MVACRFGHRGFLEADGVIELSNRDIVSTYQGLAVVACGSKDVLTYDALSAPQQAHLV